MINFGREMPLLGRFRKKLEAVRPKSFAWRAVVIGLACVVVAGINLIAEYRGFGPKPQAQDAIQRFQRLWLHYLSVPQGVLGIGLALSGAGMAFQKEWGRKLLVLLVRLVFVALFVLAPAMGYGFFIFFRDKLILEYGKSGPGGLLFGYGVAIIFGTWASYVMAAMFWWVDLAARRLGSPEYRAWTTPSTGADRAVREDL